MSRRIILIFFFSLSVFGKNTPEQNLLRNLGVKSIDEKIKVLNKYLESKYKSLELAKKTYANDPVDINFEKIVDLHSELGPIEVILDVIKEVKECSDFKVSVGARFDPKEGRIFDDFALQIVNTITKDC